MLIIFKAYFVLWVQSEICGCGFRKEFVAKLVVLCVCLFVLVWGFFGLVLVWFFLIMLISVQVSSLKLSF